MRFVEDEGIGTRQDFAETFLSNRKIGKQKVVIDDDEIRFLRRLTRLHDIAIRKLRAFRTQAVFRRRSYLWPQW